MNQFQRQVQSQNMKHQQLIMMLPKMQHALKVLQTPIQELSLLLEEEMAQNPLLEIDEQVGEKIEKQREESETEVTIDDKDFEILKKLSKEFTEFFESNGEKVAYTQEDDEKYLFRMDSIQSPLTIREVLMRQIRENLDDPKKRMIAEVMIDSFNSHGLLDSGVEEIALLTQVTPKEVLEVLKVIQTFDPPGIGARDEREALLIQLSRLYGEKHLAYRIVDKHYDSLLHNHLPKIAKALEISPLEVTRIIREKIVPLSLHPARMHDTGVADDGIIPDAEIREEDGILTVFINDESLPEVRMNPKYVALLDREEIPLETKNYIKEKILSAKNLFKSIHERGKTIQRVLELIVQKQRKFFLFPDGNLVPLTMTAVAEELGLNESTIVRACSGKYIATPRGVLALRSLFTVALEGPQGESISADTIRRAIAGMIEGENKDKPYSDQEIVENLRIEGMVLARRTVAKYRKMLNLGNAHQRRQYQ